MHENWILSTILLFISLNFGRMRARGVWVCVSKGSFFPTFFCSVFLFLFRVIFDLPHSFVSLCLVFTMLFLPLSFQLYFNRLACRLCVCVNIGLWNVFASRLTNNDSSSSSNSDLAATTTATTHYNNNNTAIVMENIYVTASFIRIYDC